MSEPPSDEVGPARKRFGALLLKYLLKNPARPLNGYNNNTLAKAIEMSPPAVGFWLKGTVIPKDDTFEKIIYAFFQDFPGHEEDVQQFRKARQFALQEPYPYRSQLPEKANNEEEVSPSRRSSILAIVAHPPRCLRLFVLTAAILVFASGAVLILRAPSASRNTTSTVAESQGTALTAGDRPSTGGGQLSGIIDPKILIGPNAGSDQSNVGSPFKIDPRLEQASRLRAAGDPAAADRLIQTVADEWSRARAVSNKNEAEAHRQLGASANSYKNYPGAIEEFRIAIDLDPIAADFNDRGLAYRYNHDLTHALADYSEAIRKEPYKMAPAYNNRGNLYLELVPPEPDRAISDYNAAIKIDPKMASAFNNRGNAFKSKGEYEKAISDYGSAIRLNRSYAVPHNGLGTVYSDQGDIAQAIASYSDAIQIDSGYAVAWINRGFAHLVMNDFKFATEDLSKAIEIISRTPDFDRTLAARAYAGRGSAYNLTANPKQAIGDFNEAILLDATTTVAWAGRGFAYGMMREYGKAFDDFKEAVNCDPSYFPTYMMRAGVYMSAGQYGPAVDDYAEVVKLAPNEPWGYLGRGFAHAPSDRAGRIVDFEQAERLSKDLVSSGLAKTIVLLLKGDNDRALEAIEPLFSPPASNNLVVLGTAYRIRGMTYAAMKNFDRAIGDFDEALRISPNDPVLYVVRGHVYADKSDRKNAIEDYGKAIAYDHGNILAYLARGNLYQREHDYVHAVQDYEELIRLRPPDDQLAMAFANLGSIHFNSDPDRAIEEYGKAIEVAVVSVNLDAYRDRAKLFEKKNDFARAIDDYTELLKIAPELSNVYALRGRAYRAVGNFDESLSDYTTQVAKDPRNGRAYDNRGDTYYASGQYVRAIEDYTTAIRDDPGFIYAYFDRGKAQEALREYKQAIDDYEGAVTRGPKTIRAVLRLYAARSHISPDTAGKELEANTKMLDRSDPLYPVVDLFLGRRTSDAVLADAGDARCEFLLYVAKWHILQGANQSAIQMLEEALIACSPADLPYYDAQIELKLLQPR